MTKHSIQPEKTPAPIPAPRTSKRRPKAKYQVNIRGVNSGNGMHFEDWPHPLPRPGDEMNAFGSSLRIIGKVANCRWHVDGKSDNRGAVTVTIYVNDNPRDKVSFLPENQPTTEK